MSSVLRGQSLINKAIELTGDAESALTMAFLNNVSLTEPLQIGSALKSPQVVDYSVVDFFKDTKPATMAKREILIFELPGEFPYSF